MFTAKSIRPSKLRSESMKDAKYHNEMARALMAEATDSRHEEYTSKCLINWYFYKGQQWIYNEDLEPFLSDESGSFRNRLKIVQNIVKPFVEYHRGNTVRIDFSNYVKSTSRFAVARKELELDKRLFISDAIEGMEPSLAQGLKDKYGIAENKAEIEASFYNTWVDKFEEKMNLFAKSLAAKNKFEKIKNKLGSDVPLYGMSVVEESAWGGTQKFERIEPWKFLFDRSAKRDDLSDGEFQGLWDLMDISTLFERYQDINPKEKAQLESVANLGNSGSYLGIHELFSLNNQHARGKVPVYKMYWRDGRYVEYGIVETTYGTKMLAKINTKDSEFTDKDLVEPEGQFSTLLNGKKKRRIWVDTIRYCIYTPSSFAGSSTSNDDIIYEYGEYPYISSDYYGPSNVEESWPLKVSTWQYEAGEILAPVDSLIDPQRLMNRLLSAGESQINNSRGSGTIIDGDMIDPKNGGEEDVLRKMNLSQPIILKARGQVNNAVGSYDTTIRQGTMSIFNIVNTIKGISESSIGGGEALTGGGGAYRATGAVYELSINQGTLMQEPLYRCIADTMNQCYQSICSRGKRIYIENESHLESFVGHEGLEIIRLTKDYELEDFRSFISRGKSAVEESTEGNELLFSLLGAGLIDQRVFAKMFNNSNAQDVARALRQHQKDLDEKARLEAKAQAQASASMAEGVQAEQQVANMQEDAGRFERMNSQKQSIDADAEKEFIKGMMRRKGSEQADTTQKAR